jgi:hypothetical protein
MRRIEVVTAILTAEIVAFEKIIPCEFNFLRW